MEFMNISGFLGGAFSKLINKAIENKTGVKSDVRIDRLNVATTTSDNYISLNLDASVSREAFEKIMEALTK